MGDDITVTGVEVVVPHLDRAVELFVGVLGLPIVHRARTATDDGEFAVIDGGGVLLTFLQPDPAPDGSVVAPGLSQLVLSVAAGGLAGVRGAAIAAGLAVVGLDGAGILLAPEAIEGALGVPVGLVLPDEGGGGG